MRFATRIFLWSFLPLGILLAVNFWVVRNTVVSTVRDGLVASVRQNQLLLVNEHERNERQSSRLLKVVSENPALKAGLQLLRDANGKDPVARATVEDQLSELSESLGLDFVVVSDVTGKPLAGIVAKASGFAPADLTKFESPRSGLFQFDQNFYQVYKIPIRQGDENVGTLIVGDPFDLAKFPTPVVLMHGGVPVASNAAGFPVADAKAAFARCTATEECELKLAGASYLSLPLRAAQLAIPLRAAQLAIPLRAAQLAIPLRAAQLALPLRAAQLALPLRAAQLALPLRAVPVQASQTAEPGAGVAGENGFELRSLQNLDAASAPVQATLRGVFLTAGVSVLAAALGITLLSSRSIVRPLASVVAHLRETASTGRLPEFSADTQKVQEIHELMDGFNHASAAVRRSREELLGAYVEFVGSLAQAVDARDPYTAGHSRRVSRYSCAIAEQMNVPAKQLEIIRIGGLLHDVGKIGISDVVLQKPGRLTPEEDAIIRQHPTIGRKILEGVHGFEAYLPIVELHHENWDGSGYPHGLTAPQTPLDARIVKVADAYDAMTSDRPYRKGMPHEKALGVLASRINIEFDQRIVETLSALPLARIRAAAESDAAANFDAAAERSLSLENLLETLHGSNADSRAGRDETASPAAAGSPNGAV